jgi:hypothetical protein
MWNHSFGLKLADPRLPSVSTNILLMKSFEEKSLVNRKLSQSANQVARFGKIWHRPFPAKQIPIHVRFACGNNLRRDISLTNFNLSDCTE